VAAGGKLSLRGSQIDQSGSEAFRRSLGIRGEEASGLLVHLK